MVQTSAWWSGRNCSASSQIGAVGHAQHLQHAGRIHLLDAGGIDAGQLVGNAAQDFGRGQRGLQGPGAGQVDQARVMGILFELGARFGVTWAIRVAA
jgi:hypothetical protein